ncbi:MAG: FecR domain-containing protein [Bacteroidota bacterium]
MNISPELLKKYATGDCTPEERQQVEQWLAQKEDRSPTHLKEQHDDERKLVWKKIQSDIGDEQPSMPSIFHQNTFRYAAAAVMLFCLGAAVLLITLDPLSTFDKGLTDLSEYRTIETQRGQKRTLTLPDGTLIRLNYESELRLPEHFEDDKRIVYLDGHAHFDVAEDPERPFIIYTEYAATRVLGTSFDIKAVNEKETQVIVTSGRVEFSEIAEQQNKVILERNDVATLLPNSAISVSETNADELTAWKDNKLVFDKKQLSEIISVLEPWYDVEITVKNEALLDGIYKFSYDNPSLSSLLDRMSFMGKFEYRIEDKQVTIY